LLRLKRVELLIERGTTVKDNVVDLHPNSITNLLKDSKGYILAYIKDGGVSAIWSLDQDNVSPYEWLLLSGRISAFQEKLSSMYNDLITEKDIVEV